MKNNTSTVLIIEKIFRNEFHIKSPNQEKPVSHKIFHITIFGGLALITLWIVLSEILK